MIDPLFVRLDYVIESLELVQEDSAVVLHREFKDRLVNIRLLTIEGKEFLASRELVEMQSFADGFRCALEIVEKNFKPFKESSEVENGTH